MARALPIAAMIVVFSGAAGAEDPRPTWEFSTSLYGYDTADSKDYVNLNFTADRGRLHLEARYNYEAIDTTSVWAGANFSAGTSWVFDSTVMLGAVFGDLEGVAPGYRISLEHTWFGLASEGEYFFDTEDSEGNYFYTWTEVAGSPTEWFRAGLAVQRTRAYETDVDVQRGVFVGFTVKSFDAAAYVFNLGWDDPTYVLALRYDF
jgi:hypothetical protein